MRFGATKKQLNNIFCDLLCRLTSKWISLWPFGQVIDHNTNILMATVCEGEFPNQIHT